MDTNQMKIKEKAELASSDLNKIRKKIGDGLNH